MDNRFYTNLFVLKIIQSRWIHFVLAFLIVNSLDAQSELITQGDYNRDSRSVVLSLNSNGFSLGGRLSKRKDGFRSRLIDFDFSWVKHPKEIRTSGVYYQNKYVYGKLNQLMTTRLSYGRQKELYGKFADGGIAIHFYYTVGLSVAWLKPVYYEVLIPAGDIYNTDIETYPDGNIHSPYDVYQGAPFFKGFDKMSFAFGAVIKGAFSFDVTTKYKVINALEIGASAEVFNRKLPLMADYKHEQYLISLFVAYRFGKKMDHAIVIQN